MMLGLGGASRCRSLLSPTFGPTRRRRGAGADGFGDVARRVLHDTDDLVVQPTAGHALDLGELDNVSGVGGEVAGAAVLAGFEIGDLLAEAFGARLPGRSRSGRQSRAGTRNATTDRGWWGDGRRDYAVCGLGRYRVARPSLTSGYRARIMLRISLGVRRSRSPVRMGFVHGCYRALSKSSNAAGVMAVGT